MLDKEAFMNLFTKTIIFLVIISCLGCATVSVPKSSGKVAICHKGKTIYVDDAAVKAHLGHGDYIGHCR